MWYSTEPKYRKYVKGYGFLSFTRTFGDKYGRKLMDFSSNSKNYRSYIWDLLGNKIADKITSLGKTKSKEKEDRRQEIYISPEKRQQIIDDLRYKNGVLIPYKNGIPKNYKFARYNTWWCI